MPDKSAITKLLIQAIEEKHIVIESLNGDLIIYFQKLQKELADLFREAVDGFHLTDGKIVLNPDNMAILNAVMKDLDARYIATFATTGIMLTTGIDKLGRSVNTYYAIQVDKVPNYAVRARRALALKLGIDGKKLLKEGYLNSVLTSLDPMAQIKTQLLKEIATGGTRKDFTAAIINKIIGRIDPANPKPGILEQHHTATEMNMFYSQYERQYSNTMAEDIGMDKARYSGPIMKTSRDFCIERVGKVFTRKEILAWKDKTWAGKNSPYDPYTDVGGYECNHTLDWVSDSVAEFFE